MAVEFKPDNPEYKGKTIFGTMPADAKDTDAIIGRVKIETRYLPSQVDTSKFTCLYDKRGRGYFIEAAIVVDPSTIVLHSLKDPFSPNHQSYLMLNETLANGLPLLLMHDGDYYSGKLFPMVLQQS